MTELSTPECPKNVSIGDFIILMAITQNNNLKQANHIINNTSHRTSAFVRRA